MLPLKEQLTALVDRTFTRNGETFTVQKVRAGEDMVRIYTTNGTFEKHPDQVPALLRSFSEIQQPTAELTVLPTRVSSSVKLQKMQDALLDALDKVRVNDSYVEQAEAISKLVQTGINLAKVELEAIKIAHL